MNKLLQKLADQCRTEYRDGHGGYTEQFDEEKFAELLIRECAGLVQGVPTDSMGYHTADQKIKEHFGVEE